MKESEIIVSVIVPIVIGPLFVFFKSLAYAAERTFDMLNKDADGNKMVYSTELAEVAVGDTITWMPASKGHNVEFLGGPDGFELPGKSGLNKEVSITFDKPGVYLYVCTPHKVMGMIALVVVGGDVSNKDSISKVKMMGRGKKKLAELLGQI